MRLWAVSRKTRLLHTKHVKQLGHLGIVEAVGDFDDIAGRLGHATELAFRIAGSMVFKEAARRADPALLEPVMAVEVTTPEAYLGTVIGDLNARRGHVQAMNDMHGNKVVQALVPLSEMFGYVGDLRSKTSGQASYSMEFHSYAETPKNIADEIIQKARGE